MASQIPSSLDRDRDKKLYEYLLTLTEVSRDSNKKLREGDIAQQWGMTENRMFIRRVVRSIEPETYKEEKSEEPNVPGITLSKLVNILSCIDNYRRGQSSKEIKGTESRKFPRILTRAEKLKALRLYSELSTKENQALYLEKHGSHLLLEKLVENITDPNTGLSSEKITKLYRDNAAYSDPRHHFGNSSDDIDEIIVTNIDQVAQEYLEVAKQEQVESLRKDLVKKIKDALRDIEYQNGAYQLRDFLDNEYKRYAGIDPGKLEDINRKRKEIDIRFSPRKFIERLTKSIVENELLTEDFPIHIKYVESKEIQPFPGMQSPPRKTNSIFAYTVKVHFYFKNSSGATEDFYEEVTGLGSPLSHAIAAINRILLWDIPSLRHKNYVPIAKEMTIYHEIIGDSTNGSVWAHHTVSLCKRTEIHKALKEATHTLPIEEVTHGEFCGFDLLEISAKAAFYARLRAIQQTGIPPAQYIKELKGKIRQVQFLRAGEEKLSNFPFSLAIMKYNLHENLLCNGYSGVDDHDFPTMAKTDSEWTLTQYEAHLSITEAYLKEGLHTVGKKYLDAIESHIEKHGKNNADESKNFISNIIIARYHLCYFRYYYLTDLDDKNNPSISTRAVAVAKADQQLNSAYECLQKYVDKCNLMDELPHINFYDFFTIMSKLHAHRAKLFFFMSSYQTDQGIDTPIKLFEQARMFAARSGNPSLYAMWTAYQSWCCLVAAYEEHGDRQKHIEEAETLLEQAMQSYEKVGEKYYMALKVASGKIPRSIPESNSQAQEDVEKSQDEFSDEKIEPILVIREFENELAIKNFQKENTEDKEKDGVIVYNLNMSELTHKNVKTSTRTFLFGTQSCILFFAQGMLELCKAKQPASLEKARKNFIYSYSFAEDGLWTKKQSGEIERISKTNEELFNKYPQFTEEVNIKIPKSLRSDLEVQRLRGMYPHRLTQFADFGKIYFVVCEMILLLQPQGDKSDQRDRWNYIEGIVNELITNNITRIRHQESLPEELEKMLNFKGGQSKYNGHLREHYESFKDYFGRFRSEAQAAEKSLAMDMIEVRDILIRDVAKIMRTGQRVVVNYRWFR